MKLLSKTAILLSAALILSACDSEVQPASDASAPPSQLVDDRDRLDPVKIQRGRQLYLKNCTVCHGINAEGASDWRQRDAQGKYPAPPLNGTGHAWHHPRAVLLDTVRHGTLRLGGSMPAWKDRLSDEEIGLIIDWFQSQWPKELYLTWKRLDLEYQDRQP